MTTITGRSLDRQVALTMLAAACLLTGSVAAQTAGQNPRPFVSLRIGVTCDRGQNHQVFLRNGHGSRDIRATVRWRVAGGSSTTAAFRINAGAEEQIGCASDASIVGARFLSEPGGSASPPARQFVMLRAGATCDRGQNAQVFLANRHSSRDINVTVRWRAAGQPYRTASFRIAARAEQQIGCAADANITGASYGSPAPPDPAGPAPTRPAPTRPRPGRVTPPASAAVQYARTSFGRSCDGGRSNTLWLHNTHPDRGLVITVRSRAAGGTPQTRTFNLAAKSTQQIGCAAEASVTVARFR